MTQETSHLSLVENEGPRTIVVRLACYGAEGAIPQPVQDESSIRALARTWLASFDTPFHTASNCAPLANIAWAPKRGPDAGCRPSSSKGCDN